jgi:hypothetical protein
VAESGKEASFLAGGEFPIPVAQASGGGTSISIQFKEFGIRLNFTPVVNGDRVHLKVRPEVSALDFSNAITLQGFRIPALSTRRTETEIELNDGQTFAIAGLLNNTMNSTMQKIPGIGDIPILGLLFRSKAAQKNRTELVVMITPHILRNDSPGVAADIPRPAEPYLPPLNDRETAPNPAPAFPLVPSPSSSLTPPAAPAASAATNPTGTPSPAAAAATLTATSPATRTVVRSPDPVPASASDASAASPAEAAARPLTAQERLAAERALKEERRREEIAGRELAEDQKRLAKQAEADRQRQKEDDERLERVNRAVAERNAEIAEREAEEAKELAKKQAEIDRKHQKEIADAQNRLKAKQSAYQAELEKLQR